MSACSDQPIASDVQYNAADYPGAGTVSVCEKADPSTAFNPALTSRRCGNNHVDSQKDLVGNVKYLEQNQLAAGNNSSTAHTVIGTYS